MNTRLPPLLEKCVELKEALERTELERDDFHREMMDLRQQLVEAKAR